MHQTKKGNQWYFGMKLHISVDSETGLVHSSVTTSANQHDITQAHHLLHGAEDTLCGDAGSAGISKREYSSALSAKPTRIGFRSTYLTAE